MQQFITKRLALAGIAWLAVPAALLAQPDTKEKKEKESMQQIVITRTGDKNDKTVVEINGDKVTVNGKDVKDLKDMNVSVHVTTDAKANGAIRFNRNGQDVWTQNYNSNFSLFSEDENRAMLGVTTEGHEKGAEVRSVNKDAAAEKAGLKTGDILTKIDSKSIESTDDVTEAIRAHKPGDKVSITYLRDGKEQKTTAELGKWKGININSVSVPRFNDVTVEGYGMSRNPSYNFSFGGRPRLGLSIQDTDEGVGVKVLDVDEESSAAKAGIRKDDIILGVDDKEVRSTDDVTKTIRDSKEKYNFNFKVQRNGKTQNIEVKLPKKLKTADL